MGEYYLGLDVGTNSVGYAVTDEQYNLLKYKGEPVWGSHVFESVDETAASARRGFRTARRRLNRRQWRVHLVQEIFAEAISKIDTRFYIRIQGAGLHRDDVPETDVNIFFTDKGYRDKEYHKEYPTIHHLLAELMDSDNPHDVRLVYIAVAWLVAHRGHFLNEMDKDKIDEVLDFHAAFTACSEVLQREELAQWDVDEDALQETLTAKMYLQDKEKRLLEILYDGKKKKVEEDTEVDESLFPKLLAGGKVPLSKLFPQMDIEDTEKVCFRDNEESFENALKMADDKAEILVALRRLFDWALLKTSLQGEKSISKAKIKTYNQHQKDLALLKRIVRNYLPQKYNAIFRMMPKEDAKNYVAYSYNLKSIHGKVLPKSKASQEDFCDFLKKELKDVSCGAKDKPEFDEMMNRIEEKTFMPKQVNGDNRVIPYQLYYHELSVILKNAEKYLTFLREKDASGFTGTEKLLSILSFRIPYFVGPLTKSDYSKNAWFVRKEEGKIYPWNFKDKVDFDQSEENFIRRMTNTCTYLTTEPVLPKDSLIYQKYMVLNEINNIKVNGEPISVEAKQGIFRLFETNARVTIRQIKEYLLSNKHMEKKDNISGIDLPVKSSLRSVHDFKKMLSGEQLKETDVEKIIERLAYSEERRRRMEYLKKEYPSLSNDDMKYISRLKYHDFGRLSKKFLCGLQGTNKETGETGTIMYFLWETNDNLMQLLSAKYTFSEEIEKIQQDNAGQSLSVLMDDLRLSGAVRRPVYRTLDIVHDVAKTLKHSPKKIFIEMARGGGEKGKRTVSRRNKIEALYKSLGKDFNDEVRELSELLAKKSDNELQREVLYLYFTQLGKDMYSGELINIENLNNETLYNVDHIFPRSIVKDDSLDNKVLVSSKANGAKGDDYPIKKEIRDKMANLWAAYEKKGLISKKKYERLIRSTPFSEEELWGFIDRQLVETRQSTKALATLLQRKYPESKIVYVKAGLTSEFRHEFGLVKSRLINDLHHAKDAYLNIVTGNVYSERFNRSWFLPEKRTYTLKTRELFSKPVTVLKKTIWQGADDIGKVKKYMSKNAVHYTRFATISKGGFFDQNPVKAQNGLKPRKTGLNPEKYGGYNKSSVAYYILAKYVFKNKADIMFVPVEIMEAANVCTSKDYAAEYVHVMIAQILGKEKNEVTGVELLLNGRAIKISSVFSFDGFRAALCGKANNGKIVLWTSMIPLCTTPDKEQYIKHLESFANKYKENKNLHISEKYDKITSSDNMSCYRFLKEKITSTPFVKAAFSSSAGKIIKDGELKFKGLSLEEQTLGLINLLNIFKTGRKGGCDLSFIGGGTKAASFTSSSKLSNFAKSYKDIRLLELSSSGLHEKQSQNLMDLL